MKLKPNQKRRYFARVKDAEGNHPLHGAAWWIVKTASVDDGLFTTRKAADDALVRAKASCT
jgi:hypothetical protein